MTSLTEGFSETSVILSTNVCEIGVWTLVHNDNKHSIHNVVSIIVSNVRLKTQLLIKT